MRRDLLRALREILTRRFAGKAWPAVIFIALVGIVDHWRRLDFIWGKLGPTTDDIRGWWSAGWALVSGHPTETKLALWVLAVLWIAGAARRTFREAAEVGSRTALQRDAPMAVTETVTQARTDPVHHGRRGIYHRGLCWEFEPEFFGDDYRSILNPSALTLEHVVVGPFCPKCAHPRLGELPGSRSFMNDGQPIYGIINPCDRCGHAIQTVEGAAYHHYLADVWSEAQRLLRLRQSFPECPIGD